MVTLYLVRVSPACRAVWLYLLQNNIAHELVDITGADDLEDLPELKDLGGHTEVPILRDGDIIIFEAPAILEYLAKEYTNHSGFGKLPSIQARCTSLLSWANSELHRVTGYMYVYPQFLVKYRLPNESANESLIENGIHLLTRQLNKLENEILTKRSYLCGDTPTVADSYVATTLLQAEWADFNFKMWPRVTMWLMRVMDQPHWDTVHAAHTAFLDEMKECAD